MDRLVSQYYSFPISLLSPIGLWPHRSANIRWFLNIMSVMLLAIYMNAQLIPLLTRDLTTIEILKNISPVCMLLCAIYKHIVFWRQAETIKEFMEEVKYDWGSMNDEELKILKEYAYLGKRYSTIFAMFVYPSVIIAMAAHFTSDILDIVSPLNESRPYWSPVATEYFVDQQKYFYPIMLYENLAIFVGGTMFVGTESLITMWLHHFAALFKIICYRIREAVKGHDNRRLINAVMLQRKVAKFMKHLWSKFEMVYSFLIILGVVVESINLFQLYESLLKRNGIEQIVVAMLFVTSVLVYMFYINYMVQRTFDCGDSIFTILYSVEWYMLSISTQKMLLFIMLNTFKANSLTVLFSYRPSIESFSMMLKTTMSYFMAIYSFS